MKTKQICIGSRKSIDANNIMYLQSDLNYTKVFLINGQMIFSSTTLKIIESRLSESPDFFRINRGIVINRQHVKNYEESSVKLCNNQSFVVSRRRKAFLNMV